MPRPIVFSVVVMGVFLAVSLTQAAQRGKSGGRSGAANENRRGEGEASSRKPNEGRGESLGGGKAPGGEWSERTHGGPSSAGPGAGKEGQESRGEENRRSSGPGGAKGGPAGASATNRNLSPGAGSQNATAAGKGKAAGAAAANAKRGEQGSGTQGTGSATQGGTAPTATVNNNNTVNRNVTAGGNTVNRSGTANGAGDYSGVRNSFDHPDMYGGDWYGAHATAWAPAGWAAGAAWSPASWNTVSGMYGYGNTKPLSYNYGSNVNYANGNVMVAGQNVGTAAQYSQQAATLAAQGAQAEASTSGSWLPLGVFAMVRNEQQHPQLILQMAMNDQGTVRGNYTDEVTGQTSPIQGAVDKKTQRAAWTVGENSQTVMEAGLSNLTEKEAPALIHKNGKTDHWILVRLEQPK